MSQELDRSRRHSEIRNLIGVQRNELGLEYDRKGKILVEENRHRRESHSCSICIQIVYRKCKLSLTGRLDHVSIIAEKQIYASHYFGARFKFSVVIDNSENSDTPGVFLICLDHSLFDENLSKINRGFLSLSVRKKLQSKFRSIRSQLESTFRFL